jgi:hypothetical protein
MVIPEVDVADPLADGAGIDSPGGGLSGVPENVAEGLGAEVGAILGLAGTGGVAGSAGIPPGTGELATAGGVTAVDGPTSPDVADGGETAAVGTGDGT